jgi:hypothetical protein
MGNFSLQRSPWNSWELQTSPSDSRLPSSSSGTAASPSVPLCHHRSPPAQAPELHLQLQHTSTRRFPSIPTPFLFPGGFSHASHDVPELFAGCHLLVTVDRPPRCLNSFSLTRSNTTPTPTFYSATPSAQLRAPELHFAAAVSFHSGRAQYARGQPTPDPLRPNQHPHQFPRVLLVLDDPLIFPNFH